jgi:tetratricopeptide (TPR) repeat protein
MAELGNYILDQNNIGNSGIISTAAAEEDNLLAAWRLARAQSWSRAVLSAMQGLRDLYNDTGRGAAWRRLVEAVVPEFVDPETDGARPGIDPEDWAMVTSYRVRLARSDRRGAEAERLQRLRVDVDQNRAQPLLAAAPETLGVEERNAVRNLAVNLHELGELQREAGEAACADSYRESLRAAEAIGDTDAQATCAMNLGLAYKDIPNLRDLGEAESWLRRSLDLRPPGDKHRRAKSLNNLGNVAWERFNEARAARRPDDELARHLTDAVDAYEQALDLTPEHAVTDRGITHNSLGVIFAEIGDIDRALDHYRQCIRYRETAGDTFHAGRTRFNVAIALLKANRLVDARSYAMAALANFESFGDRAADHIQQTQRLIEAIDQAAAEQGSDG